MFCFARRHSTPGGLIFLTSLAPAMLVCAMLVFAMNVRADDLRVSNAWVREAPPLVKSHAAYMKLENSTDEAIEIISVIAEDYDAAMIHKTVQRNGMSTMEHVDSLSIPPHSTVELKPGEMHIMLMNPKRQLKVGDTIKLILCFDREHHQEVTLPVKAVP